MQPTVCLLDQDIRKALKKILREQDSTAAIIDELPLMRGRGRADLAFVNGKLCGYEIKSDADSLVRLGMQAENYGNVFEFSTLVAVEKHLKLATQRIPQSWGIIEVQHVDARLELHLHREPQINHRLNNQALARLLWKNECRLILKKAGIRTHPQAPVIRLWNLVEALSTEHLCGEVKEALKRRQSKFVAQQTPYDD